MKSKVKKILITILSLTLVAALFTGCGSASSSSGSSNGGKKKLKVALIVTGLLGDKSFNDLCYKGLKKAEKDYNIDLKVLESKNSADWETNLVSMASANYDLVICSSTQLQDALKKHASEFPKVKFGIIDGYVKGDNILSAVFAQNQSSFLVGAAAAMLVDKTNVPNISGKKTIGFIGGMDIPVINDFLTGYKQGAKYIDPNVNVLVSYAGTFNDPLKGKELALSQFNQGADIIFNCAAGTGTGVLEAANQTGKYAIGCDVNQDSNYPGHVFLSELKNVDKATYLMVQEIVQNKFKGDQLLNLDINNDGVDCSDMSVVKQSLGDKFPSDIPTKLDEIKKDIKSGKIKVDHAVGFSVK